MELIKATEKDFGLLATFYRYVTEHTASMTQYGRWIYGLHPTDQIILQYIRDGYLFYSSENGTIASAVAIVPFQTVEYHGAEWSSELADEEVGTVHILCVNPDLQGRGYSRQTMEAVEKLIRQSKLKAIRLDALSSNMPARKLYESIGYRSIGERHWYAENTGWTDFILYEKQLDKVQEERIKKR